MPRDKGNRAIYTPELKRMAVRLAQGGPSKAAVARLLDIPESTLRNWLREAARLEMRSAAAQRQIETQGEPPAGDAVHADLHAARASSALRASASRAAWWVIGGNALFLIGSVLIQAAWHAMAPQTVVAAPASTIDTPAQPIAAVSASVGKKAKDPRELIAATNRTFAQAAAAFEQGDYANALRLLRPLAAQGHARAQNQLGILYDKGLGVAQDPFQAHKWFSLAAASESNAGGQATAMETRDIVAAEMSPGQLAEAEQLAREWKRK